MKQMIMKIIGKILLAQISMGLGGFIAIKLMDAELMEVVISHITLTAGYLYGFWNGVNN